MAENWEQSRLFMVETLKRIEARMERLENKVDDAIKVQATMATSLARTETEFKIKSGAWGVLGGMLSAIALALMGLASFLLKK